MVIQSVNIIAEEVEAKEKEKEKTREDSRTKEGVLHISF